MRVRFLIFDENSPIIDVSRHAFPDAPPVVTGPSYLLCPHCGHDERSHAGPHEMFSVLPPVDAKPPIVSSLHFRCRECEEVSPVWVIRRDGAVTSHMRDLETEEACMPLDFDDSMRAKRLE